ncbi:MAG: SPASM domain-containing protein [Candidatus Zixiibacteriota bacterium]|nr:MAG: SPASM domain-containing protein [candidate division Zixibacteria bacterium]
MTDENYACYEQIKRKLAGEPEPSFDAKEKELVSQLQYGGFVLSGDFDEREDLTFRHLMNRYDQTTLGLVIAPTMACNMACEYCYEADKKGRMSAEIVETILDFVEKRARNLQLVDINWYGGEPLLAMDIIEDITESMQDLAEEYKFTCSSSMISNGYLLTKEIVDKLRELKVSMIQITLDGPARIHNRKRPLKNGRESYDTIVENIKYATTKMAIGMRVNVDKSFTEDTIAEMLCELKDAELQDRVGIYFGLLEPATSVCANISESCYNNADFSKEEIKFYRLLLEHGFRIEKLPSPVSVFCMSQDVNSFLIDPGGNLYRCFNHVGNREKSMGNIKSNIDYNHPNFTGLFRFNPFLDGDCKDCAILPVCMGGCPSRRADRNLKREDLCESWKHNLPQMLEIIALSRQQQAKTAAKEQT